MPRPMSLKILLIDDDDPMRRIMAHTLELGGHCVRQARDGREGLEQLDQGRFDLVITDISMPEMDGLEVLAEARRRGYDGKVLAMSGGVMGLQPNLHVARLMGAQATLSKPFSPEELETAIQQLAPERPSEDEAPLKVER